MEKVEQEAMSQELMGGGEVGDDSGSGGDGGDITGEVVGGFITGNAFLDYYWS